MHNDDNQIGLNAMYKASGVFTAEGYTVYNVTFQNINTQI